MKTALIIAIGTASLTSFALPTYEPFTEYAANIATNTAHSQTNSIDLCTAGLAAPSGEPWVCQFFSGTDTNGSTHIAGLDIQVTNNPASPFTYSTLSALLPAAFPGLPSSSGAITTVMLNPAQPGATNGMVGNSACLRFGQDIVRPATGVTTLFVSYIFNDQAVGQTGSGNFGRYLNFVAASNVVCGTGTGSYANGWQAMNNTFGTNNGPRYFGHGAFNPNPFCIDPQDSAAGKPAQVNFSSDSYPVFPYTPSATSAAFVVGEFVFVSTNASLAGVKDTNILWVNPDLSVFGGAAPPSSPIQAYTMPIIMTDVGGMVLLDRPGSGQSGGVGTTYIANLMLGSTWSYVTGGPEFTVQPTNTISATPGSSVSIIASAVAAGQTVSYQWQKNGANITDGAGGAGGGATVSGSTAGTLTLSGGSTEDSGTYTLIATSLGTGYTLTSTNTVLTITDPDIATQPQSATVNYRSGASFSATVVTVSSGLSYAWYNGPTMLANGLQPDGSTITGAKGATAGGTVTITMTITNVTCSDSGSYTLMVTNASGTMNATAPATLTVNDPYIGVQPPASVELDQGGSGSILVTAAGTGVSYQWFNAVTGTLNNSGDDSGVMTSNLVISGVQVSDAGTYYVAVTGTCGSTVISSNTVVYVDTAPTSLTVSPPTLTQQEGTHLALVANLNGGSGLIHLTLQLNGTNLNSGLQPDGSFVFNTLLTNVQTGALILSNLQASDSGTYTVIASNAAGMATGASVITVVPTGQIQLSTNNLIVSRVGEGSQALSGATGNTMYLDQFTTNGAYVNTIMVPDSGTGAVIVAGAAIASGNEGAQEGYLTTSSNQQFINFGGFCYNYPYTAGPDVTAGAAGNVRGIYAVNGAGIMALVYTNYGLYSGGHGFRDVYSTDGLTNFWTTGSASSVGTVKYVNAGPAGAPYTITTPGQGIPALTSGGALAGGVCLGLAGSDLVYAENGGDAASDSQTTWGLDQFPGVPMTSAPASQEILLGGVAHADDFSFSPDLQTVYVADDDFSTSAAGYGGIQRWDYSGGTYQYSYNLSDTTGTGTNGMRGIVVHWPAGVTAWGPGVEGAVIFATTSEVVQDRIIEITDTNGANSPSYVLATAGPNQFYRGIRFGPIQVPLAVNAVPATQSVVAGQSVDLVADTTGNFSYYFPNAAGTAYNLISVPPATFQWYDSGVAIPGATNFVYSLPNAQTSNSGSYYFVLTSGKTKVSNSVPSVLTVNSFGVESNLVGWFQFDDGSGTNAADSSGYGDTGALYNFPTNNSEWVAGLGGLFALDFANADSNNDNVVLVPDAEQLNFTNNVEFTLSAWVNSALTNQPASGGAIISKGYGNGGEEYNLDVYNNTYRFFVRNSAGTVSEIASSVTPPLDQWQNVAVTFDGNEGVMDLYVDGQLVGTNTAPNSLLFSSDPLSIGNREAGQGTLYDLPFVGDIQDVRLYNVAYGLQDIQAIYASQNLAASVFPPSASTNAPPAFVASGQFKLTFSGVPGSTFHLWSTTNLALKPVASTWTLVTTGTFDSTGTATYTDTTASGAEKYYTITQP